MVEEATQPNPEQAPSGAPASGGRESLDNDQPKQSSREKAEKHLLFHRLIAGLLDAIIIVQAAFILFLVLIDKLKEHIQIPEQYYLVCNVVFIIYVAWAYFAVFEGSGGRSSLGKKLFGMIVVKSNGEKLSTWKVTTRFVLMFISILPAFLGMFMIPFNKYHLAWHDAKTGTMVRDKYYKLKTEAAASEEGAVPTSDQPDPIDPAENSRVQQAAAQQAATQHAHDRQA